MARVKKLETEFGRVDYLYKSLRGVVEDRRNNLRGFVSKYCEPWGGRLTNKYQKKLLDFIDDAELIARACPIKYNETGFKYFNGKIYETISEDEIRMAWLRFLRFYQIVEMLRDRQIFRDSFLKTIEYYNQLQERLDLVAFENGVLDLSKMEFNKFSPEYHVTYYHPYRYDPKADCPKWKAFLREVLPDKTARVILQMFLGLGLIERGTAYNEAEGANKAKVELCLILIGRGGNGKSVIYEAARGIFGPNRISGVDYDDLTAPGDEGMRARRLLREAIFNWTSDSDSKTFGRKRSGVFKRIVSGEPVTDRAIGHDVSENYRMPYLVFNLNAMPGTDDDSLGFIRRLQFIPFDVAIPKERQNKSLSSELISEYPGIFNWIIRGMRELKRRKYVFPSCDASQRKAILVQMEHNVVVGFITAYGMRTDPDFEGEVGADLHSSVILASLRKFCEDNDFSAPSDQLFGATMRKFGFSKRKRADGNYYKVFGCDKERLQKPFYLFGEYTGAAYKEENSTYIERGD